ncbi:hypothetical protein QCA50_014348 [Cerrena zonata]|uniref:Uncharacterized protein n=1 Tax=Cerrena zonata TaxID=2478898 RepID=A0AAW0FY72_9APHY
MVVAPMESPWAHHDKNRATPVDAPRQPLDSPPRRPEPLPKVDPAPLDYNRDRKERREQCERATGKCRPRRDKVKGSGPAEDLPINPHQSLPAEYVVPTTLAPHLHKIATQFSTGTLRISDTIVDVKNTQYYLDLLVDNQDEHINFTIDKDTVETAQITIDQISSELNWLQSLEFEKKGKAWVPRDDQWEYLAICICILRRKGEFLANYKESILEELFCYT